MNFQSTDFPICDELGCDTEDLGPYNSRLYNQDDGCKKGYTSTDLENHGNICRRTCGEDISSKRRVRCTCDFERRSCQYTVKSKNEGVIEWVDWKTLNQNQEPLVSSQECFTTTMTINMIVPSNNRISDSLFSFCVPLGKF